MKVYFVRHADKAKGDFHNSHVPLGDQPISRYGRKQAHRLRRYFQRTPIAEIYVSEYIRTEQTVRPLARKLRLVPRIEPRLNEIDIGELDGLADEQIRIKYPETWKAYREVKEDFRLPGGETGAEAQARIVGFLNEQIERPGDKLVVAHDGIIRLLLCHLLKIPVYRRFIFHLATTGILEIEWENERGVWHVIRFNQELM